MLVAVLEAVIAEPLNRLELLELVAVVLARKVARQLLEPQI
jgi:hypothetical protein